MLSPAFILLAVSLFYVNEPVIDMREEATHSSRIASQALFAEEVRILENQGNFVKIMTPDGYTGWAPKDGIVETATPYDTDVKTSRLKAHLYDVEDTEYGPIKSLPYGSRIKALDAANQRFLKVILPDGHECYIQKGDVESTPALTQKEDLFPFSLKFLGLPYTWGGRSSFGYDCSGFVQMLYSRIGIELQRDARLQVLDARFQDAPLDALERGDLIFFGKQDGQILHVGMSIGNDLFIHATPRENQPWIRISSLTDFEWSGNPYANYPYRKGRRLIPLKPL